MRFELSGTMTPSGPSGPGNPSNPPELILTYTEDDTFDALSYADLGYTAIDVICIGGGGGAGGGYYAPFETVSGVDYEGQKHYGGAGGGGGLQKISADLLLLPDSIDIVVGQGGPAGTWHTEGGSHSDPKSDPETITDNTDGTDGGHSSFNDTTCRASGGKGGSRVHEVGWGSHESAEGFLNDGGDGGIGNSIVAGGGGSGGKQFRWDSSGAVVTDSVPAADGSWDGTIGSGGGGGYGGGVQTTSLTDGSILEGSGNGGSGSPGPYDTSVRGPGGAKGQDPDIAEFISEAPVPGFGGGASVSPFTGMTTTYGNGVQIPLTAPGQDGVVVIRLTQR